MHAQSGNPYTIRYAQDLTGTTQVFCTAQRTCNVTTPEGRNTARSASVRLRGPDADAHVRAWAEDRLEVRADVFNLFNNENFTVGRLHRHHRQRQLRQADERSALPGPAVPVRRRSIASEASGR